MTAGTVTVEQAARSLVAQAHEVAVCLDVDGTLSPVVDDPQAARPLEGIVELLEPLARRFAAVAIISGRPAPYLAEHIAASGVRYLGLYGLQEVHEGRAVVDPRLEAARPTVAAATAALADSRAVRESGAWLEDKIYSVAVHTRRPRPGSVGHPALRRRESFHVGSEASRSHHRLPASTSPTPGQTAIRRGGSGRLQARRRRSDQPAGQGFRVPQRHLVRSALPDAERRSPSGTPVGGAYLCITPPDVDSDGRVTRR